MKKSFLLLAGLILLAFTACQNDELVNGGSGNETAVSFSVQLPGANAPFYPRGGRRYTGEPLYHGDLFG